MQTRLYLPLVFYLINKNPPSRLRQCTTPFPDRHQGIFESPHPPPPPSQRSRQTMNRTLLSAHPTHSYIVSAHTPSPLNKNIDKIQNTQCISLHGNSEDPNQPTHQINCFLALLCFCHLSESQSKFANLCHAKPFIITTVRDQK